MIERCRFLGTGFFFQETVALLGFSVDGVLFEGTRAELPPRDCTRSHAPRNAFDRNEPALSSSFASVLWLHYQHGTIPAFFPEDLRRPIPPLAGGTKVSTPPRVRKLGQVLSPRGTRFSRFGFFSCWYVDVPEKESAPCGAVVSPRLFIHFTVKPFPDGDGQSFRNGFVHHWGRLSPSQFTRRY